jgi:hypothetical protein
MIQGRLKKAGVPPTTKSSNRVGTQVLPLAREKPRQGREAVTLSCGNCHDGKRQSGVQNGEVTWHS